MDLPDFMSYSDKFSPKGFVDKISRIAKRAGAKLVYAALVLFYTLQSKDVSVKDKAIIVGALGYLISPFDVLPDAIPIVGLSDDLTVLVYVISKIWVNVPDDVKEMSHQVLRHRIGLNYSAFADGVETEQIIDAIVSKIKLP